MKHGNSKTLLKILFWLMVQKARVHKGREGMAYWLDRKLANHIFIQRLAKHRKQAKTANPQNHPQDILPPARCTAQRFLNLLEQHQLENKLMSLSTEYFSLRPWQARGVWTEET